MAGDLFPYEIKRLIYDSVDLQTLRALRQVSKAWASVGLELLLLPTYFVKSEVDIRRLVDIGKSPSVSPQAAKTIKKIVFQSDSWDPNYFRKIICNRHEHRTHYETLHFVPTEAEAEALEELDKIIAQRDLDVIQGFDGRHLSSALLQVPQVDTIVFVCRNPFTNGILRKAWEEYDLETYRYVATRPNQFLRVISATKEAGLDIRHLSHEQLLPSFFTDESLALDAMPSTIRNLKSLNLIISDIHGVFSGLELANLRLRQLISSIPKLESLSVEFQTLDHIPPAFLPTTPTSSLHSLSLSSMSVEPEAFLSFLDGHAPTLKQLCIRSVDIPQGHGSWRELLGTLRTRFGEKLEKFQLAGMIMSADDDMEQWHLWSLYDYQWNMVLTERNIRTREIEDFVLRGGLWPMLPIDTFPFR